MEKRGDSGKLSADERKQLDISYGRTYRTCKKTRVGVLPIGYADGLFRALSNQVKFMTASGSAPQLGRICMDMCMVDVTDIPGVKEGDTAILYGDGQPVEAGAEIMNTISYELLCVLTKRIRRVYI